MKLSLIIPYYDTLEYTKELMEVLIPQLNDEVEVLIIDDGCHEEELDKYISKNIRVLHKAVNSGNASVPRNLGLIEAKGEYIGFIDSDDMVTDDYIQKILYKIQNKPDIIFLSWKMPKETFIITSKPLKWNCAVWCRVYKREIIGNTKFDENLKIAEDWKFNQAIKYNTSTCIREPIYLYNSGRKGSLTNG